MKELLILRVWLLIDGLFFTSEAYLRVKSIVFGKFGKSIEIAAFRIEFIISLPVTQNLHLNWIHDYYEKLVISVQALGTMSKLK